MAKDETVESAKGCENWQRDRGTAELPVRCFLGGNFFKLTISSLITRHTLVIPNRTCGSQEVHREFGEGALLMVFMGRWHQHGLPFPFPAIWLYLVAKRGAQELCDGTSRRGVSAPRT